MLNSIYEQFPYEMNYFAVFVGAAEISVEKYGITNKIYL
jgi:hypothetical protein